MGGIDGRRVLALLDSTREHVHRGVQDMGAEERATFYGGLLGFAYSHCEQGQTNPIALLEALDRARKALQAEKQARRRSRQVPAE